MLRRAQRAILDALNTQTLNLARGTWDVSSAGLHAIAREITHLLDETTDETPPQPKE